MLARKQFVLSICFLFCGGLLEISGITANTHAGEKHTWISISDEVGRRDYEISATATDSGPTVTDVLSFEFEELDTAFSDYLYNRITLLLTSDLSPGISFHLFANWQPEDHRLSRHDTDTRIVSGGIEYRF